MVSLAFHSSSSRAPVSARRTALASVSSVFGWVADEWRIRLAIRSVEEMEPHMLADLGISPSAIEDAVRHGR